MPEEKGVTKIIPERSSVANAATMQTAIHNLKSSAKDGDREQIRWRARPWWFEKDHCLMKAKWTEIEDGEEDNEIGTS